MKIVKAKEPSLVKEFLGIAGDSLKTLRYYKERDIETAMKSHIVTFIGINDETPVAYGHLDKEDDVVWLGIAVAEHCRGLGLGTQMMQALIDYADENRHQLKLSVDVGNPAISLYRNFGFLPTTPIFMERKLE